VRSYPILSAEAERALCYRWCDHHDISAAHQLVGSHLRLVARVAKVYRGYGLPLEDLIGEGHVGMMRALCRFEPNRGVRFASYALWWVRASIQEYILYNWSAVKIGPTASQKKLLTANFSPFSSSGRRRAVIDTKVSAIPSYNGRVISSLPRPLPPAAKSCNQATNYDLEECETRAGSCHT
jgi:RNA polymerase sigma factor (sigma-70 family)